MPGEAIRHLDSHAHETEAALIAVLLSLRERLKQDVGVFSLDLNSTTVRRALSGAMRQDVARAVEEMQSILAGSRTETVRIGRDIAGPGTIPGARPMLDSGTLAHLADYQAELITSVGDELRSQISRILSQGVLAGKSSAEIAAEIGLTGIKPAGPFRTAQQRAQTIARTETHRLANMAAHAELVARARRFPALMKQWVSMEDARVRPTHIEADGQQVPVSQPFKVGGFDAMYPGDPALPAREVCNCRCVVTVGRLAGSLWRTIWYSM